jgi:hypothetical protein
MKRCQAVLGCWLIMWSHTRCHTQPHMIPAAGPTRQCPVPCVPCDRSCSIRRVFAIVGIGIYMEFSYKERPRSKDKPRKRKVQRPESLQILPLVLSFELKKRVFYRCPATCILHPASTARPPSVACCGRPQRPMRCAQRPGCRSCRNPCSCPRFRSPTAFRLQV